VEPHTTAIYGNGKFRIRIVVSLNFFFRLRRFSQAPTQPLSSKRHSMKQLLSTTALAIALTAPLATPAFASGQGQYVEDFYGPNANCNGKQQTFNTPPFASTLAAGARLTGAQLIFYSSPDDAMIGVRSAWVGLSGFAGWPQTNGQGPILNATSTGGVQIECDPADGPYWIQVVFNWTTP
jgi:hypothetical protein